MLCSAALAGDFASLCSDRATIERVYYNHRLGEKPPFEHVLPSAALESLVRRDLHKEAVLKNVYGVEVTPAMLKAEVQRIITTTRAPDVLAEIKAALGNDSEKFAVVFAQPILAERELRQRFDNDDALHAAIRRECEKARHELLAAKTNGASPAQLLEELKRANSNAISETIWQLIPRSAETNAPGADELEIKKRFGQNAQILASPESGLMNGKFYFEDLPAELQKVLRVQLCQAGDVSSVIETPKGFLLYLAKEKTSEALSVAVMSLPKRDYEQWLAEQTSGSEK